MKTILIKFDNSFFVRNFLRTDVFTILRDRSDIRMVFLVPADKRGYYAKEFAHERAVFEILPESKHFLSERLYKFIETSSIHSHTQTMVQRSDFVRTKGQGSLIKRAVLYSVERVCWHLGSFAWWRSIIRRSYYALPSRMFTPFFERFKPDLVYCSSLMYTDFLLLKEARKEGIATVGMILSWDNLYSKTLLRVFPDTVMAHTDDVKNQLVRYADYPAERVRVTGIAQYDRYFRRTDIMDRDAFIKKIGGDPAKKLIVYAVSGKAGLFLDTDIMLMLADGITRGAIEKPSQIFIRPHPRYDIKPEKMKRLMQDHQILAQPAMAHVGTNKDNWEFDEEAISFLANTIAHADIVVALYTTFFIEAAVFDKPLIAVGFDERHASYWDSAKRFFEWDHLRELDMLKGIWRVGNREELMRAVNTYLEDPAHLEEGRRRIVAQQSQFTDGRSGERVARVFLDMLEIK